MHDGSPGGGAGARADDAIAPPEEGRDSVALDVVTPDVYAQLREIAHQRLARGARRAANGTLATTALVHEAYLKLAAGAAGPWRDRRHFLAVASMAMRQILVDRARSRATGKRGGAVAHATLDDDAVAVDDRPELLLEIDHALDRLTAVSPRLARLVELRFFGGLADAEVAEVLGVTARTVQRDWQKARMLLERALAS